MSKVIVVAVEYLNTLPFIYGITYAGSPSLRSGVVTAIPAACAQAYLDNNADIALVPVGALRVGDESKIITNFCISATGIVKTVALLCDCLLNDIKTIYLDSHSRTSVELVRLLARDYWHISPAFVDGVPDRVEANEAVVVIGDKVFEIEKKYKFKFDLSEQWQQHTGLPFVFAVWVAVTDKGRNAASELNEALKFGVANIEKSIPLDVHYARNLSYLTCNIEFEFTSTKRQAMELFLKNIRP